MTGRFARLLLLLAFFAAICAATAAAQTGGTSKTSPHDHSTLKKGGSTLAPVSLSVGGSSFSVVAGKVSFGTGRSSTTILTGQTLAAINSTTLGRAVSNSTITFCSRGEELEVWFDGWIRSTGGNNKAPVLGYLLDGGFPPGQDTTHGAGGGVWGNSAGAGRFSMRDRITPASGCHTYALTLYDYDGGTATIGSDPGSNSAFMVSKFGVRMVP